MQDAETMLDRPYLHDWPKDDNQEGGRVVEVIESEGFVTVLVDAPGCGRGDVSAVASLSEVRVRGPDFQVKRQLPCLVERSSMVGELRNGVYSLTLAKLLVY